MNLWPIITIGGPILLIAALAWAIWRNKQSPIPRGVTEAGTREVYAQEERLRREGKDDIPEA
jgi:hypothetical protein